MKKLFIVEAIGVQHHRRSFTIKHFIGYNLSCTKAEAETFAIDHWRGLHPKVKLEQLNVMQVPTAALFGITSQHALKAPEALT